MASINKLSIRGVRSFSPEDAEQVVEFYFPITIIVGANGCGKTTIIESLKYAITGALPPGARSGQAFVHDAKAMGRPSCKASVKLRFTSRSGQEMVVVRSMELAQKKTVATFKQLDGLLRTLDPRTGERISLSHKCSELDRQLPLHFGVSSPILEHVLFCHQEDASWPLQEGAVLKKRFDDIFDSTRYSKALEVFRKTEKELLGTVKDLKAELAGFKSHRHAAQGFRKELEDQNDQVEALDEEKKQVQDQLAQSEAVLEKCAGTIEQVERVQAAIENKKNQLAQYKHVADSQLEMLEENLAAKHSLSELQAMLSDFDEQSANKESKLRDMERQHQQHQQDHESLRKEEISLSSQIGKYSAEKEAHERRLKERYTKMEAIATAYNVDLQVTQSQMQPEMSQAASLTQHSLNSPGAGDTTVMFSQDTVGAVTITPQDMQSFFRALDQKQTELKEQVQHHRAEAQDQEDKIQKILTELGGKLKAVGNDRARLTEEKLDAQKELSELSRDTFGYRGVSRVEIDEQRKKLATCIKDLDAANSDPRRNEIPIEITQLLDKITRTKDMIDADRQVLEMLRLTSDTQQAIGVLEEQSANDTEHLEEAFKEQSFVVQKYGIPIPDHLPTTAEDDSGNKLLEACSEIADALRSKFAAASDSLSKATAENNKVQRTVAEKKALLASSQNSLATIQARLAALNTEGGSVDRVRTCAETLRQFAIDEGRELTATHETPSELVAFIDDGLASMDEKNPNPKMFQDVSRKIFRSLLKMSRQSNECPCCRRELNAHEAEVFISEVNALAQMFVERSAENAAGLEDKKALLKKMRNTIVTCTDDVRDFGRLSTEAATLEGDVRRLQDDLTHSQSQLNSRHQDCSAQQGEVNELRAMVDMAKRWYDDADRICQKRMQIAQKREDLSVSAVDKNRDLRTVEQEINDRMDEKDAYTTRINNLNQEMSKLNSKISMLSTTVSRMEDNIRLKESKYQEEQKAANRKSELKDRLAQIAEEEKKCQDQIVPLKQKISLKEAEKSKLRAHSSEEGQGYVEALNMFQADVKHLRDLVDEIDEYARSSKPDELSRISGKVASLKDRIDEKLKEIRKLEPVVEEARSAFKDQERHKKQLRENISYIEGSQRIEKVKREIAKLQSECSQIKGHETVHEEHSGAARRKEKLLAKKAQIEGRWFEVVEHVRSLKRKLSAPEYKKVDEQCRVAEIKHATTQMAAEDLKKYYNALDQALLQFHGKKIGEINKIIRDLWMMTYKGEDIGNIEIVSGQEPGSRAQKSYNYRVVMTKGSSQMDMRGRCSAGQRVLASVVIRLALAEAFGVNCGCIALDEPTVNLDFRNKKGLAISLAQIVASRAQQRNFQLVLITHDEEFVSMMKTELSTLTGFSMPDKYFQVRREQGPDGKFYSKIDAISWDELV